MDSSLVLSMLSRILGVYAIPAAVCGLWAAVSGSVTEFVLFLLVFLICVVVAGVLHISVRPSVRRGGIREAVALLFSAWLILSVIGALPFYVVSGSAPVRALFEAISCATTTGTSLIEATDTLSAPVIFWRGCLHLLGATTSISGTLLLLSLLGSSVSGVRQTTAMQLGFSLQFSSFFRIFLSTMALLIGAGSIITVILVISGLASREAFALAFGAVTTGQIWPFEQTHAVASGWTGIMLSAVMLLASMNAGLLLTLRNTRSNLLKDRETIGILGAFLCLWIVFMVSGSRGGIVTAMVESASVVSTSGLLLSGERLTEIGIPVVLFFGFIGGSAASSAGGIKMYRISLLISRSAREFSRLVQPNAVLGRSETVGPASVQAMMSVWVYLVGFALVSAALASFLALAGYDFDASLLLSVGAATNSEALFNTALLGHDYHWTTVLMFSGVMLFGRLELLILLALFVRS